MKTGVQKVGRFLSGMVMPNIGAFIAWGLITALFIATGWVPNERLAALVDPMIKYLLPLLIGYTGGKTMGGERGGVVGAIATMGVIIGADMPMFLGAMIAGPIGGWCIKKFDKAVEPSIPQGLEMLVNNFSAGIIGMILAIVGFLGISPLAAGINTVLGAGVQVFVNAGLLPLAAVFVEPGKVLFLNNAINHGVFTPLGIEETAAVGKSIFYMIESNPGPGLGLLLAYCVMGKGNAKSSAPGAVIIHFLGGIHEIYFPYVLMNPILILATMGGNAAGIFTIQTLGGGLIGPASPGSIFAELMMTPRGSYFANIAGITIAAAVSFALSIVLLRFFGKDEDLEAAQNKIKDMKAESKGQETPAVVVDRNIDMKRVGKIVFACDAGMGSSAMGATALRKKLKAAGLEHIEVTHSPVSEIPSDAQIVVTHNELKERAAQSSKTARIIGIANFMGAPEYDALVSELVQVRSK